MSQLVVSVAGAAVGFMVGGPVGAQWGWMAGTVAGALMFPPTYQAPKIGDLSVTSSAYGSVLPYLEGHLRMGGQVIWASPKRELQITTSQGKGGSEYTYYNYEVDLHILLTENPISGVARIWSNGKLIWTQKEGATNDSVDASNNTNRWSRLTVYTGAPDQMPDPDGHPDAPAYRGRGSVFIKDLGLGSSGSIPVLTFEVTTEGAIGGGSLFTASYPNWIEINSKTGAVLNTTPPPDGVDGFDMNTEYVASSKRYWVTGYGSPGQTSISRIDPVTQTVEATLFIPDSDMILASASHGDSVYLLPWKSNYGGVEYTSIYRIDDGVNTLTPVINLALPVPPSNTDNMAVSPDGSILAIGCTILDNGTTYNNYMRFYDVASGGHLADVLLEVTQTDFRQIIFSKDGSKVYATAGSLFVLDVGTLSLIQTITQPSLGGGHTQAGGVALSADGSLIYLGYNVHPILEVYSASDYSLQSTYTFDSVVNGNGQLVGPWTQHFDFSPDGLFLYCTSWSNNVVVCFDTVNQTRLMSFLATPDGTPYPTAAGGNGLLSFTEPTLEAVVTRLCLRAGLSQAQFDASPLQAITTPVHGMAISSLSSTRAVLEQLASAYFFECRLSDKLYFIPRQLQPVAALPYADLGVVAQDSAPIEALPLLQKNELEIPSQVALTYVCEQLDYQTDTQFSDRLVSSQINTRVLQLPLNFSKVEAKKIVDAIVLDQAYAALGATVSLDMRYAHLETGDIVAVSDQDGQPYVMRITKKRQGAGVVTLELVNNESSVLEQTGQVTVETGNPGQTEVPLIPPTSLAVLDIPSLWDADTSQLGYYAAVGAPANSAWSGALLEQSLDGVSWTPVTNFSQKTIMGTTLTSMGNANHTDGLSVIGDIVDFGATVYVNVGAGNSLASIDRDKFLSDDTTNLAWIGTINPETGATTGELLRFQTATLISPGVYRLTNCHRGLYNTQKNMLHNAGERFVLLSPGGGVQFCTMPLNRVGVKQYFRVTSYGNKPSSATVQPLMSTGANLRPFAPVGLRADHQDLVSVFSWIRRTRLSTRFLGEVPIGAPLGEANESYLVQILNSAGTSVVREVVVNSPSFSYTVGMQLMDFGSEPPKFNIRVSQLSAVVGVGNPTQAYI